MLTSRQNPLIKQIRKLHRAKARREQELLLLEGTNLLAAYCATGQPLAVAGSTPTWQQRHPDLWAQAVQQAQRAVTLAPELLAAIVTTVTPDGAIAAVPRDRAQVSPALPVGLGIGLEQLQDPGNLGTAIRTAAAAGCQGLWLSAGSADPESPKVLRASAGEWFRLPMAAGADLGEVARRSQQQGMQVVASCPQAARPHWAIGLRQPTLLLVGNEGAGLSPELAAVADVRARIPLQAGVESLNAAIATALLAFEAVRQRQ
jgi:TrmH family RNA methyltransferase